MPRENEYYLYWDLFELYDIFEFHGPNKRDYKVTEDPYAKDFLTKPGIYQIYSRHLIHGPETLLYIGMSMKVLVRLDTDHMRRRSSEIYLQEEQDVRIRVGRVLRSRRSNRYEDTINERSLRRIEGSLIAHCAPIYNLQHRSSERMARNIRIYNSGDFGSIPGEISHYYHTWGIRLSKNRPSK